MEPSNPYQPPTTDVAAQSPGGYDQTSPFSPKGRFGRLSYLAWGAVVSIVGQVIMLLFGGTAVFTMTVDPNAAAVPEFSGVALAAVMVVGLVSVVIGAIFAIRRCHDFNASGWWILLILVPIANFVLALVLLFKRGTDGANNHGPARITPGWEKVVGIIGIVLFTVTILLVVTATIIPAIMSGA